MNDNASKAKTIEALNKLCAEIARDDPEYHNDPEFRAVVDLRYQLMEEKEKKND